MAAANESNHTPLLCLNDGGKILVDFLLPHESTASGWLEMQARVCIAASLGASTLVRIQKYPFDYIDPLQIKSRTTNALYDAINLYDLHMVEVILPCYMDIRKN